MRELKVDMRRDFLSVINLVFRGPKPWKKANVRPIGAEYVKIDANLTHSTPIVNTLCLKSIGRTSVFAFFCEKRVRIHWRKSEFTGEMESDFREVILSHCEYKLGIGHEDVAAFAVEGHELMLALLECFEG